MAVTNYSTFSITLNSVNSTYTMSKDKIFIGRSSANDIVLLDATVDPIHASVEKRAESQYYLTNLSTPVKTKINGSHITGDVLLGHGSIITIGRATLIFSFGEVDVKIKKIFGGASGHFPLIDSVGGLLDSGYNGKSFAPFSHAHDDRYYTKPEIDDLIDNSSANVSYPIPISYVDGLQVALDGKAPLSILNSHTSNFNNPHHVTAAQLGVYTKAEVDALIQNTDLTNYYTKSEVDALLANVTVDLSAYYTKTQTDSLIAVKQNAFTGVSGNFAGFDGSGHPHDSGYGPLTLPIGNAEDDDYTDGLFTDLTTTTRIGVFADRVNEVLKSLSPSPAPNLSAINFSQSGANGKVSFDASNPISTYSDVGGVGSLTAVTVDNAFNNGDLSGYRHGIFAASTTSFSGTLASNVSQGNGSPNAAYPAYSFGDGNAGTLKLYINNSSTPVQTVDLTTFGSGNNLNGNGSGFNLSAATSVSFPSGGTLDLFQYRTGTWIATGADLRAGWNYVTVIHTVNSIDRTVAYHDFIRDLDTTATSFSSESLTGWSGTGLKYLSGVKYYTGGSANYAITISNAYRNTYVASNAVSFSNGGTPLQSISSNNLPANSGNEAATYSPTKTANVTASGVRLLNQGITVQTTVLRTVQSTQISSGSSVSNILLDNVAASSTTTSEPLDDENYRLLSSANFDNYTTGATSSWTSSNTIADAGSAGYNDGLQIYGGQLVYPSINFSAITNGPASNANYSTGCTGARSYYRFFSKSTASNFTFTVSGTSTPRASSYSMTNGSNDIKIDIRLPNSGGEGTGWLDVTQLFATAQWSDGDGCLLSGSFSMNSAMSLTVGTKNTGATSVNGIIFIRIRVPQGWTGSVNSITLV